MFLHLQPPHAGKQCPLNREDVFKSKTDGFVSQYRKKYDWLEKCNRPSSTHCPNLIVSIYFYWKEVKLSRKLQCFCESEESSLERMG